VLSGKSAVPINQKVIANAAVVATAAAVEKETLPAV